MVSSATASFSLRPSTPPLPLISSMASCSASTVSRPTWTWIGVVAPMTIGFSSARASDAPPSAASARAATEVNTPRISISSRFNAYCTEACCTLPVLASKAPGSALAPDPSPARGEGITQWGRSLRRGRRRRRAAEGGEQRRLALLGLRDVALLDVAEAAHLLRQPGDLDSERVVVGAERRRELADHGLVLGDETALHAPLLGAAEDIER